jgi:hypothetical protein
VRNEPTAPASRRADEGGSDTRARGPVSGERMTLSADHPLSRLTASKHAVSGSVMPPPRDSALGPAWPEVSIRAELTNRKLRRSAHRSVTELEADVRRWINEWNADPKPFIWTKTADQILDTLAAYCSRIIDSRH